MTLLLYTEWTPISNFSDHKPLIYAFQDHQSLIEIRQLDFIPQITSDIRFIDGKNNSIADALSRMELNHIAAKPTDFQELAANQECDTHFAEIKANSSLPFKCFLTSTCDSKIHYYLSTGERRPIVLKSHRRKIFD